MAKDAFDLKKYFFPVVNIRANTNYKPDEEKNILFDIESAVVKLKERDNFFQLILDITINDEDSKNYPYMGQVQAVGFFDIDSSLSKKEAHKVLRYRGIEILYAAIREIILMVTGRGPWGVIGLPTHHPDEIEMLEIDPNQDSSAEE